MFYSENILTKEKLKDKSPRGQVYVEAHNEEVQGRESRGQGNLEWKTDLIEKNKLENNTRQVAQDLQRRNTNLKELTKNNTADPYTKHLDRLRTQSLAWKLGLQIPDGTNGEL